ncbi:hypothetical protein ACXR0O_06500 [Verrucomicrobiota bacterium sgz303538]
MRHDEILEGVIVHFRRGLVLKRMGRQEEAQEILENVVPAEIQRWSEANTGQGAEEKKAKLRDIFLHEVGRIEDAFLVYDLLSERIEQDIIPALCNQVNAQLYEFFSQYFAPPQQEHAPEQMVSREEPAEAVERRKSLPRAARHVSFDDISGMIDMLLDQDYEQRQRGK